MMVTREGLRVGHLFETFCALRSSDADQLEIVGHLWTKRRLPGLDLTLTGDLFETQPDDLASWRRAIVDRAIGIARQ